MGPNFAGMEPKTRVDLALVVFFGSNKTDLRGKMKKKKSEKKILGQAWAHKVCPSFSLYYVAIVKNEGVLRRLTHEKKN